MDPLAFIERFVVQFQGANLEYIRSQIEAQKQYDQWDHGTTLRVTAAHGTELAGHFSWSRNFDYEIHERYAYLPVERYAQFVKQQFEAAGFGANIVAAYSYLQEGYTQHVGGRLDFFALDETPLPVPIRTGIVVVEKTGIRA